MQEIYIFFIIVQKINSDTPSITTDFVLLEGFDKINLLTKKGRSRATLLVVLNEIACVYLRIKYNFRDIKTPLEDISQFHFNHPRSASPKESLLPNRLLFIMQHALH